MNATSCKVTVLRQSTVAADIRCLTVQWPDASRPAKAGQFFMLRAWAANETPILSRPISVHDFDAATGALTFLYQVKGEGTQKLAALKEGDTLTVTGPCGNGFDVAAIARAAGGKNGKIAVVGGGIGTAPLLQLCKEQFAMVLTCGPMVMMRGVYQLCAQSGMPCVASLERKMACGLGACLGCTCRTKVGAKTVCKDGPVFKAEEVFD